MTGGRPQAAAAITFPVIAAKAKRACQLENGMAGKVTDPPQADGRIASGEGNPAFVLLGTFHEARYRHTFGSSLAGLLVKYGYYEG